MSDEDVVKFVDKLIYFVVTIFGIMFLVALLAGCATSAEHMKALNVKASPEEAAKCLSEGCSMWTDDELQGLIDFVWSKGYISGKKSI
jgi:hypothetical protein